MSEAVSGAIPRIGEVAPDFVAETTQGVIKFSEWQGGKWVVLFSHPADFTPVCTTELAEFARRNDEFVKRDTKLIGLSIDSIHSHMAWLQNIKERLGVEIPYPLIADIDMKVAQKFGMLHPEASSTATVRAVFFINPDRKVQALVYYPLTNGRNIDEVLRLLDSLQTSSKHSVATPANWRPGDKVIIPPPRNVEALQQRMARTDMEHVDFYLGFKQLEKPAS
ncbi:peroxiredoxin (alkyl hydroperoxide reductase subunit C) [Nannocystis exedens]|uniref:Peroxiredoxin n=1 Tax=Nannocystis exedens TaxID=54 RepID=A0A1I1T5W3_9BACT|nr:peroxiredoxin [Nannocystis exedens]PCC66765.1 peroxiredoxin [Nannocystis exedens]SFD53972.1 peroxiredoxin (alkyl hydroperoxide reductase subunit C) [Nannocystis exedens]